MCFGDCIFMMGLYLEVYWLVYCDVMMFYFDWFVLLKFVFVWCEWMCDLEVYLFVVIGVMFDLDVYIDFDMLCVYMDCYGYVIVF